MIFGRDGLRESRLPKSWACIGSLIVDVYTVKRSVTIAGLKTNLLNLPLTRHEQECVFYDTVSGPTSRYIF